MGKTKILLIFLFILLTAGSIFAYQKFRQPPPTISPYSSDQDDYQFVFADIDGDGTKEKVNVEPLSEDEGNRAYILVAYNQEGEEIARIAKGVFFPEPMTGTLDTVKLIADLPKETIRFDVISGPHSSETFFFTKVNNEPIIAPICKVERYQSFQDCTFWSGELGELLATDIDEDKALEIIELVDEYPQLGEIGQDIEEMIQQEFSSEDISGPLADTMVEIAKRETGGRGRKVVWKIYRLGEDQFFEEQTGADFDKLYLIVADYWQEALPDKQLVSRDDISQASYNFAQTMQKTWRLEN